MAMWNEKHTYGLYGMALGAIGLAVLGFQYGNWHTDSSAKTVAEKAVWKALTPLCADAILANPLAVAALDTKKVHDYDDVVRDYLKTFGGMNELPSAFRRDCGAAIDKKRPKTASKS